MWNMGEDKENIYFHFIHLTVYSLRSNVGFIDYLVFVFEKYTQILSETTKN